MNELLNQEIESLSNIEDNWIELVNWVNPTKNVVEPKLSTFQEIILLFYYLEGLLPNKPAKCSDFLFNKLYATIVRNCKVEINNLSKDIYFMGNPWRLSSPLLQFIGNTGCLHFIEDGTVWEEPGVMLEFTYSRLTPTGLKYIFRHRLPSKYLRKAIL